MSLQAFRSTRSHPPGLSHHIHRPSRKQICNAQTVHTERSNLVEREIVLFVFQQELDVQMQRALNYEQFEAAKEIRSKRDKIDEIIVQTAKDKGAGAGTGNGLMQIKSYDNLSTSLNIQGQLNEALEKEDYQKAAELRDRLKSIKDENDLADAEASEWEDVDASLRLGQRVTHKDKGYQGLIVGWDMICCESAEWQSDNDLASLVSGPRQPFYHVLVDTRDMADAGTQGQPPSVYLAQELLCTPEQNQSTWIQSYGGTQLEDFVHPYTYLLFLGLDNEGNYLPTMALRSVYNENRRDVYPPGSPDTDEDAASDSDST